MKKYIGLLLAVILSLSVYTGAYAENEEASMSVDVIPVQDVDIISPDMDTLDEIPAVTPNAEDETIIAESEPPSVIETNTDDETGLEIIETADATEQPAEVVDDKMAYEAMFADSEDSWSQVGSLVTGRANFETVVIDNTLYAIGGYGSSGYTYSIEKYNDSSDKWEYVTSFPKNINGFSTVCVGTSIYLIGGYCNSSYLNEVNIYNTSTGKWSTGTPMIERRDAAAAIHIDNKIYVFGGRNIKGFVESYEYYDISSGKWNNVTTGFDESIIRVGAKGQYINGYICIYGGLNQNYENMGINVYLASDMNNNTALIGKGYEYISIAWGKDKALAFIASSSNLSTYKVNEIVIKESDVSITSVTMADYPLNMQYTQNVMYNGYLYCMGGYDQAAKSYNADMYKYSVYYGDFVTGDGNINSTVTADGNTITLNVEADKDYVLLIHANNMETFNGYTFTVELPNDGFGIIDACMLTDNRDIWSSSNYIEGTNIRLTQCSTNGNIISFQSNEVIPQGKKVTETINAIHIRANSSGQRKIIYRMTR